MCADRHPSWPEQPSESAGGYGWTPKKQGSQLPFQVAVGIGEESERGQGPGPVFFSLSCTGDSLLGVVFELGRGQ